MRKTCSYLFTLLAVAFTISGCGKKVFIEEQQFALTVGIDLDEDDHLVVYTVHPVFTKVAPDSYKITSTTAASLRESRRGTNAKMNGNIAIGKIQNIILGKKLLQQRNVINELDVFFRDPQIEVNANMMMIDGPVKEAMYSRAGDRGRLDGVIKEMIENSYNNRITVQTTLQKFHQQMLDKGMTACISELKASKNDLVVSGVTLLDKKGKYAASLNNQESALLLLLQRDTKNRIQLTLPISPDVFHVNRKLSYVSLDIKEVKTNITSTFQENRFTINIQMNIQSDLTERMFASDMKKERSMLVKAMEEELKKECENLIRKAQKHQIDPFQLGVYVRANDYKNWRKVEEDWGKAFSEATVTISPRVTLKSAGVVE